MNEQCTSTTAAGTRCTLKAMTSGNRHCVVHTRAYDRLVHDNQVLGWHLGKHQGQTLTVEEVADAMHWTATRTRAAIDFELKRHGKLENGYEAVSIEVTGNTLARGEQS